MPGTGTKAGGAIGLALVVVALAAGASVLFLAPTIVDSPTTSTPTPSPSPPLSGGVPIDQNEDSAGSSDGSVVPFITGAFFSDDLTSVTVYSFVPKVQESDGTCTASIVGGSATETASMPASIDVAGTTCAPLTIALDTPVTGSIEVVVAYESSTSEGRSEPSGVIEP